MKRDVILLVEDNADDVKRLLRAFERNNIGNEVVLARDGSEALDRLFGTRGPPDRELPEPPSLVLLDLKLPRVSGLEVLERLRADPRTRHIPVIVLTSSWEERDLVSSYELGANVYVRKPVQLTELLSAARTVGLYWTLLASGLALLHRRPIPAGSAPPNPERPPVPSAEQVAGWPMECLVVTSDRGLLATIRAALVALGHRCQTAGDARDAFGVLELALPHLVVVDSALPDIRGAEVVRALRRSPYGDSVATILLDDEVATARDDIDDASVHVLPRAVDEAAFTAIVRALGAERVWLPQHVEEVSPGRAE